MKLGIKVGLQKHSIDDLSAADPAMAEVWFNINRVNEYSDLFSALKQRSIDVGLHFWGALEDHTLANIAYPDKRINGASVRLIQQAIDVAASQEFRYVNIHPGQLATVRVDLIGMDYPYVSDPVSLEAAMPNFLEHAMKLDAYAKAHGIVLTIETVSRNVPKTEWYNPDSRLRPFTIHEPPPDLLLTGARNGLTIANDFVHTATHCTSPDPDTIWRYLKDQTVLLSDRTRLIHLGFLVPPLNGTDNHDMLDNPVFDTHDAVPNKQEMIELLKCFSNRGDLWILVEPPRDHVRNYHLAKKLLEEAVKI
ncbi:sugar phosphate isomerase/epimerase [Patescibacteria group bacterium]|nr:sugar phosphate isomerase/epimerase [Patescibacteria group bacterium]